MKNKKLKTNALFLLLVLVGGLLVQEAVSATGSEASGTGSNSIGQVVYPLNTGTNDSVAQSVQQPYEISTTAGIDVKNINLKLSVYPNSTTDYITLLPGINKGNAEFNNMGKKVSLVLLMLLAVFYV